ncbi:MAG: hypothetical protein CW691_10760 [Candidatus Bathyarchaeum sp.]|nr:MAG: hypothetical protein CW691_10760 [Candidatus Bathyarchaeum sp.]
MPRKKKNSYVDSIKFPSLITSNAKPRRDARRAFTATQRKEILYQQSNKCAKCHEKLDPRATQFDHKKSWASGGRTITQNGRALCSTCHDVVTHNKRLKTINKPRKSRGTTIPDRFPSVKGELNI